MSESETHACVCGREFETLSRLRLHEQDECPYDDESRKQFRQPCCCCDQPLHEGGDHINLAYTPKKAEWDYPAAGNVHHGIEAEYAMALVCDECLEADRDVKYVVKGQDYERVPIDDLEDATPMHERILDQLPEEDLDEAHAELEELIDGISGDSIPVQGASEFVAAVIGEDVDGGFLILEQLIREGRLVALVDGDPVPWEDHDPSSFDEIALGDDRDE